MIQSDLLIPKRWRSLNPLKGSRFHHPKKVTAWITRHKPPIFNTKLRLQKGVGIDVFSQNPSIKGFGGCIHGRFRLVFHGRKRRANLDKCLARFMVGNFPSWKFNLQMVASIWVQDVEFQVVEPKFTMKVCFKCFSIFMLGWPFRGSSRWFSKGCYNDHRIILKIKNRGNFLGPSCWVNIFFVVRK